MCEFKLDIIQSVGKLRFSLLRRIFVKPTKQWIRCLLLQRRIFTSKERNKRTRIQDCAQFTMQEQFKNRFDRECHLCPSLTVSYVCGWKMKKYIVGSVIFGFSFCSTQLPKATFFVCQQWCHFRNNQSGQLDSHLTFKLF